MTAQSVGGLQYHHKKIESGLILEGKLLVKTLSTSGNCLVDKILEPGSFFTFTPGLIHQEKALTECFILETSSPHLNDRVRYDEVENPNNTLRSTTKDEVVFLDVELTTAQLAILGFEPIDYSDVPSVLNCIAFS